MVTNVNKCNKEKLEHFIIEAFITNKFIKKDITWGFFPEDDIISYKTLQSVIFSHNNFIDALSERYAFIKNQFNEGVIDLHNKKNIKDEL